MNVKEVEVKKKQVLITMDKEEACVLRGILGKTIRTEENNVVIDTLCMFLPVTIKS